MSRKSWAAVCFAVLIMMMAVPALACDHVYGGWWTKRNPTCRLEGLDFKDCRKCDHWEKRYTPKLKHTPDEWVLVNEPTCTYRGSEEATCTACGDRMRRFLDMKEHNFGEMTITKESTCLGQGKGQYVCQDCGKKKYENLPSLGHEWVVTKVKKEPTCKAAGSGEKTCQRCGRVSSGQLDRLEHVFAEWEIESMPSGAKKGVRNRVCTLCDKKETERFYEEGTLYQDMKPCEEVMKLQKMLRDLDYYNGTIRTGTFGKNTGSAVSRFQKANGMAATEIADPETIAALVSAWEAKTGLAYDQLVVTADK